MMTQKVLIIDDEIHIRTLLKQTLEDLEENYGVEILTASNGEEGLALIRNELPEIVFLDIMLPQKNGYDVCKTVTEDPKLKDIKIILLTAKGQEIDRIRGMEAGALKYMTKPFDPDEVVALTKNLLTLR
jgi:DNA-binding response OmpR family regulator